MDRLSKEKIFGGVKMKSGEPRFTKRRWGFFEADPSMLASPENRLSGLQLLKSILGDNNLGLSEFLKIDRSIKKLEDKIKQKAT